MLLHKLIFIMAATALLLSFPAGGALRQGTVETENVDIRIADDFLNVNADIILDSLRLKSNRQLLIIPLVKGAADEELELPAILVDGRNMHYSYERGVLNGFPEIKDHVILQEVRRDNG